MGIFDTDIDTLPHLYEPKNFDDLIKCIKEIVKVHKNDKIIDLNDIDTSLITDMSCLFTAFNKYNFDVSEWDVSKVKDMAYMFQDCKNFNCDLSNWDVSNVEDMTGMFYGCKKFNCDLSKWNVKNVKQSVVMFTRSAMKHTGIYKGKIYTI